MSPTQPSHRHPKVPAVPDPALASPPLQASTTFSRIASAPATECDLLHALDGDEKRLVELIDGMLVEKSMGKDESHVAGRILQALNNFLDQHPLGLAFGADGPARMISGNIRLPDVSYYSWERLQACAADDPILTVAPDLAVEVISRSNRRADIDRKRVEFFASGTIQVWEVMADTQTVRVYTSAAQAVDFTGADTLDGGSVLPGFALPIANLFRPLRRLHGGGA